MKIFCEFHWLNILNEFFKELITNKIPDKLYGCVIYAKILEKTTKGRKAKKLEDEREQYFLTFLQ